MSLFKQAQIYHDRGFSIIPQLLFPDDKGKIKKVSPKEVKWKQYQNEQVSKTVLLTQWKQFFPPANGKGVAIITGPVSDLTVVDIDDSKAADIVKTYLPKNFKTVTVRTGSGGWHLYFKYRPGLITTAGLGDSGLDIRTNGGYVAAPPSRFPDGREYTFAKGRGLDEIDIAVMPDSLFNHLVSLIKKHTDETEPEERGGKGWFIADLEGVGEGRRTHSLTRLCGQLKRLRVPRETAWDIIVGWNANNQPPEDPKELEYQFKSIWKNVVDRENVQILNQINEQYSIILSGNNVRIMYEDDWQELHFLSKTDFNLKFENQRIPWGNKTVSVADLWLEWPDRKTYDRCVFNPSLAPGEDESTFNLWKGFSLVPKAGNWDLYRQHVEQNIAPSCHDWVFKWMARILQEPGGERPGTTLVLRGKPGTGKGIFCNLFGKLLGQHYTTINNLEHLTGRFNKELLRTVLLYIDEATWGGNVSMAGMLKNLITEPTRRMEAKNIDAIYVDNHLNLIISSNNKWVVPGSVRERRFLVLDMSEEYMQDKKYFGELVKQMRSGGFEAMMHDLMHLDYTLEELREIPRTSGTREQVIRSLDIPERFWYERLTEGTLVDAHEFWKYRVVTDKLYNQYIEYCSRRNFNHKIESKALFTKALHSICPSMETKQTQHKGQYFRYQSVPSLEQCRKEFDAFLSGQDFGDWPEAVEPEGVRDIDRENDLPGSFRTSDEYPPF